MKNHTRFIIVSEDEVLQRRHGWKLDTVEEMQETIIMGMPYRSLYTYSTPPNPNEPAPFIFGGHWIATTDHRDR